MLPEPACRATGRIGRLAMSRATISCCAGGPTMMPGAIAARQNTDQRGMGRGWLGSVPARSAATEPVTATAPVADIRQDSATGSEALRVGWRVYLMGLLGLTLCRAFWGARDEVSCCADHRAVAEGLAW